MNAKRFGPGGTGGLGYEEGLLEAARLGLNAFEVEFTHGVTMSDVTADFIKTKSKELGISISCHAPYYINLSSDDKVKIIASEKRILDSAEKLHRMGGKYVVFHAGYYGKMEKEACYDLISKSMERLQKEIAKRKLDVVLAPETPGKLSAFGDLDELFRLKKEFGTEMTVDFAHLKARTNGIVDYTDVFNKLKHLKHIHSHFSGIEWTDKGEKRHIVMTKADFLPIAREIKRHDSDITIICESPEMFKDAKLMKEVFENLKM